MPFIIIDTSECVGAISVTTFGTSAFDAEAKRQVINEYTTRFIDFSTCCLELLLMVRSFLG